MDGLLANHNVGLALIDTGHDTNVPAAWIEVGELMPTGEFSGEATHGFIFYARWASDVGAIVGVLDRLVPTLPSAVRLIRAKPDAGSG